MNMENTITTDSIGSSTDIPTIPIDTAVFTSASASAISSESESSPIWVIGEEILENIKKISKLSSNANVMLEYYQTNSTYFAEKDAILTLKYCQNNVNYYSNIEKVIESIQKASICNNLSEIIKYFEEAKCAVELAKDAMSANYDLGIGVYIDSRIKSLENASYAFKNAYNVAVISNDCKSRYNFIAPIIPSKSDYKFETQTDTQTDTNTNINDITIKTLGNCIYEVLEINIKNALDSFIILIETALI